MHKGGERMIEGSEGRRMKKWPLAAFVLLMAVVSMQMAGSRRWLSYDDPIWYHRSVRWPVRMEDRFDYRRAIDVPAVNRWVYGAALHAADLTSVPGVPKEDLSFSPPPVSSWTPENVFMPRSISFVMRGVNALLIPVMFGALLWVAASGLGSWTLALATILPLVMTSDLSRNTAFRIGPDIFLLAGFAASLVVWQHFHKAGRGVSWKAVAVMGVVTGLTTASKLNGGLVLLAYALYAAVHARGVERLTKPIVACAVAFAVFVAVNPVFYLAGKAPWTVVTDMLARRAEVIEKVNAQYGRYSTYKILTRAFDLVIPTTHVAGMHLRQVIVPMWAGIPVFVAIQVWAAKRFAWMEPVVWWGVFIFFGTMLTINNPVAWYTAPMYMGMAFPTAVAVIALAHRYIADNLALPGRSKGSNAKK